MAAASVAIERYNTFYNTHALHNIKNWRNI